MSAGRISHALVRGPKPNCQLSWEVVTPSSAFSQSVLTWGGGGTAGTPRTSASSWAGPEWQAWRPARRTYAGQSS
ncbi:hypothetical protein ACIP9X_07595 [Arthrobacter sp. NPDC093125]|uniref:hypothetical protein n=1 Tax=Arthrobacter sp. NPDC093125 TaxID=3363944 RepID=UPI00382C723A